MSSKLYDPIMDALLALLKTNGDLFEYYSRKFVMFQDIPQMIANGQPVRQPACLLYDGPGFGGGRIRYENRGRGPGKRTLNRTIVIYAQIPGGGTPGGKDIDTPGASPLYPLIEAIEATLEPSPSSSLGVITLGGLVTHCWIEGEGVIIPGDIDPDGQCMATIPVNIVIP